MAARSASIAAMIAWVGMRPLVTSWQYAIISLAYLHANNVPKDLLPRSGAYCCVPALRTAERNADEDPETG